MLSVLTREVTTTSTSVIASPRRSSSVRQPSPMCIPGWRGRMSLALERQKRVIFGEFGSESASWMKACPHRPFYLVSG
jgi:hypothetical protein